jgi:hypothetical protein
MRHRYPLASTVVAAWLLMYSDDPDARSPRWREIGRFGSKDQCESGRAGQAEGITLEHIGSALAAQPADNPLRQRARGRALEQAKRQFRCQRE